MVNRCMLEINNSLDTGDTAVLWMSKRDLYANCDWTLTRKNEWNKYMRLYNNIDILEDTSYPRPTILKNCPIGAFLNHSWFIQHDMILEKRKPYVKYIGYANKVDAKDPQICEYLVITKLEKLEPFENPFVY